MSAGVHRSVGMALSLVCLVLFVICLVRRDFGALGGVLAVIAMITGFWWAFAGPREEKAR